MHGHFSFPGSRTHADVLQRSAETRLFVSLEMVHRDDHVRFGDGRCDFGRRKVLEVDLDLAVVETPQPVGDKDRTACGKGVIPVFHGGLHVVDRVCPVSLVEGVRIRQERFASPFADQPDQPRDVIRPDRGQVTRFPEMDLHRNHPAFQGQVVQACGEDNPFKAVQHVFPRSGPHSRKEHV